MPNVVPEGSRFFSQLVDQHEGQGRGDKSKGTYSTTALQNFCTIQALVIKLIATLIRMNMYNVDPYQMLSLLFEFVYN
jgi:hypothetical protein